MVESLACGLFCTPSGTVGPIFDANAECGQLITGLVGGRPMQNRWAAFGDVPAKTELAEEVAKALKAKGFKFVGPVIVYAWMQAVGMVNDHFTCCFRHDEVKGLAR